MRVVTKKAELKAVKFAAKIPSELSAKIEDINTKLVKHNALIDWDGIVTSALEKAVAHAEDDLKELAAEGAGA